MNAKLKNTEIWFKTALAAVFIFLYLLAQTFPVKSRELPQLVIGFTLFMIIISLILDFARKTGGSAEKDSIGSTGKSAMQMRFYRAWGIILFSTLLGFLGGILFTAFSLFFGFALFSQNRKNLGRNSFIAVLATVLIYFIFQQVMEVPMLEGILW